MFREYLVTPTLHERAVQWLVCKDRYFLESQPGNYQQCVSQIDGAMQWQKKM